MITGGGVGLTLGRSVSARPLAPAAAKRRAVPEVVLPGAGFVPMPGLSSPIDCHLAQPAPGDRGPSMSGAEVAISLGQLVLLVMDGAEDGRGGYRRRCPATTYRLDVGASPAGRSGRRRGHINADKSTLG